VNKHSAWTRQGATVEIYTKFGAYGATRTVTVELFDKHPGQGGTLLRSAGFTSLQNQFSGAIFALLPMQAGEDYFIGFRNLRLLGCNVTSESGATSLGTAYFSWGNGSYSTTETSAGPALCG